jgi:hypothetical protein
MIAQQTLQGRSNSFVAGRFPDRILVLLLNLQVDLFSMYGNAARRGYAESNLIPADLYDHDLDVVADLDALIQSPSKN